jgi:MFS transporter, CP family, cyanate transporter
MPMDGRATGKTPLRTHATTGALAVAAIVLVAVNLRPGIVSVGPLLPSIIDQFRLSHAAASLRRPLSRSPRPFRSI